MAIHIKKSKRGSLHKALGIPEGKKIPASMLKDKPGDSAAMRKKKNFARNARKWKHQYGGPVQYGSPEDLKRTESLLRKANKEYEFYMNWYNNANNVYQNYEKERAKNIYLTSKDNLKGYVDHYYSMASSAKHDIDSLVNRIGEINSGRGTVFEIPVGTPIRKQYSIGGNILSGAGTGVSTFAALAPIAGTGVGLPIAAALGLGSIAMGLIKDKKEKEEKALKIQKNQELANAGWNNYVMATGGLTPYGTEIEVEDGEVMQGNDGSLVKFNGPTHAEGGIDISAEPGARVFGKLKIKEGKYKGMTYKEAADKIMKQIAKLEKLK